MADFVAHHLFGEQMLSVFPADARIAAMRRPACFRWGLQGPDPLFYRKLALGSPLHKLGNRLHNERTDELFYALARTVNLLTGEEQTMAEAYFYGFLCHYALDSTLHPYVYCRQEQIRETDPRLSASAVHCQIESDIDHMLYLYAMNDRVTNFDVSQHYRLSFSETAVLAAVLSVVIDNVYAIDVPTAELRGALREMRAWEDFLYSDSRLLYKGAQRIEQAIGRGAVLTGHMKVETPDWDCLNEDRAPWHNLWTPEETHTESVLELIDDARAEAAALSAEYAAEFAIGGIPEVHYPVPFSNGSPNALA